MKQLLLEENLVPEQREKNTQAVTLRVQSVRFPRRVAGA
jgi:hypothetical protein